jgi:CubicO group peptidase (beta-lactamase class C family)
MPCLGIRLRWTPERISAEHVGERRGDTGGAWNHSNTEFLLAGLIIEEAAGMMAGKILRCRFVEPLGWQRTFLCAAKPILSDVGICHGGFDLDRGGVADDATSLREAICRAPRTSSRLLRQGPEGSI